MPSRNVIKQYASDQYYHVYSRGVNKQEIFPDENDYKYFLSLFERYLSGSTLFNGNGEAYPSYHSVIELLSYCLMPNHIHLLLYQTEERAIAKYMSSMMTSYTMYFNKKYKRVGPLFQGRYRASIVINESYLMHLSRYIHMNPINWRTYCYSSLSCFLGESSPNWLHIERVISQFSNKHDYLRFLTDYEEQKNTLGAIKNQLPPD